MALARLSPSELAQWTVEQPEVVAIVQRFDARTLEQLVDRVGVENLEEFGALVTTEQLERVFDEELWRSEWDGEEGTFDDARCGLWIEILLEGVKEIAVEKMATMDEEFVARRLSRHAYVFDLDAMQAALSEAPSNERQLVEAALASALYADVAQFRVVARDAIRGGAVIELLSGRYRDHQAFVRRILERCCAATSARIEDKGGTSVALGSGELRDVHVAAQRVQRREREGSIAPSVGASFLRLARSRPHSEILAARGYDPITKAHFRAETSAPPTGWAPVLPIRTAPEVATFVRDLHAAGSPLAVVDARVRPEVPLVTRALQTLLVEAVNVFGERFQELTYLVNVLIAVSRDADRAPRTIEAVQTATTVCDLGMARLADESAMHEASDDRMLAYLAKKHGLIKAFRVGWNLVGDERWSGDGLRDVAEKASRLIDRR
jgi:hypothetical protein